MIEDIINENIKLDEYIIYYISFFLFQIDLSFNNFVILFLQNLHRKNLKK